MPPADDDITPIWRVSMIPEIAALKLEFQTRETFPGRAHHGPKRVGKKPGLCLPPSRRYWCRVANMSVRSHGPVSAPICQQLVVRQFDIAGVGLNACCTYAHNALDSKCWRIQYSVIPLSDMNSRLDGGCPNLLVHRLDAHRPRRLSSGFGWP